MRIKTHLQVMQAIKGPPARHSDTQVKGLYLIVSRGTTGSRSARWVYRYTKPATGKVTELGLGPFDTLSLEHARMAAQRHRSNLKQQGQDPVEAKRAVKAQVAKAARSTFGSLAEDWITEKASGWSANTLRHMRVLLRHATALANKPITGITSDAVVDALKHLRRHAPEQERRALDTVRQVFEYAEARDLCDRNPAERGRMKARYPKRNGQRKHYSAMPYTDVPAFVQKLHSLQERNTALSPWAIEFMLFTASRVSEVTKMRWDEVDMAARLWTIPKERMKAGKEHRVPLSVRALQLLAVQKANVDGEFVWPGMQPGVAFNDRSLYMFLTDSMGLKGQATLHGFRSTFRDWCGDETEFARDDVEQCLAHAVGSAVERAYRRGSALEKRRVIMQAWSDFCCGEQEQEAEPRAGV
ncbi:Integrase [Rhizobiales bacterium GAS191]|nr:Integrase [Rhizobiales bacterium GAS191]